MFNKLVFLLFFVSLSSFAGQWTNVTTVPPPPPPPDYSSLMNAIDMSTTSSALLVAAVALIGVYILWKGATMIMGAFRGR